MREWVSFGRWHGVPVRAHWTLGLWLPFAYVMWRQWVPALMAALAYVVLLLVHEGGHAIVARWRGLHVLGIELQFLHGHCVHDAADYEIDDIWVAWGGVLAQALLLAAALVMATALTWAPSGLREFFAPWVRVFVWSNLLIIAINLLPFETLDGRTAWRVLPHWRQEWQRRWAGWRRSVAKCGTRRSPQLTLVQADKIAADAITRAKRKEEADRG